MSAGDFEQHRAAFLDSLRVRHCAPATIDAYGRALESFCRTAAPRAVREVTAETVRAYQLDLAARGLKASTQRAYGQPLRRFFAHLEKTGVIFLNPCLGMLLPKCKDRLPRWLTPDQARLLINAPDVNTAKGLRDRAILELFYSTGIRLAELAALTVTGVDCRGGLVHVVKGKGGKDRTVPAGQKAVVSLQRYLLEVRAVWAHAAGAPLNQHSLWLSSLAPHRPLKAQAIQVMVRHYGRLAGVPVTPHLWRHTCATHLVNSGADIAHVQLLLGHASLETTQIYTRVTLAELKAAHRKAHPRNRPSRL